MEEKQIMHDHLCERANLGRESCLCEYRAEIATCTPENRCRYCHERLARDEEE